MSPKRQTNQFRSRWPEWLLPAFFLPSWLMSLGFHMIVFVGVALIFQNTGVTEGLDDSGRVVDIFVKEAANPEEQPQESANTEQSTADDPLTEEQVDESPPEELVDSLLDTPLPFDNVFAPGPAIADVELPLAEPIRPARPAPPAGGLPPGRGETQFFGTKDKGTRFAFVIDCSGSMQSHNAIHYAKAELKNSISLLEPTQQFQIIYYNQEVYPWHRRGRSDDIYWANETNKRLAYNFVDERGPTGGTDHVPALMMALRLTPEVIYFLTDADQSDRISNRDMARINKFNGGRTRIHCIEFGVGPQLDAELEASFLADLARKNGGSYRYLDVKKLSQR